MTHLPLTRGNPIYIGAAYMVAAGLLFALINTIGQSLTMQHGQLSTSVAFWQYFIALLFSIPWILPRLRAALSTSQLPIHILRVILSAAGVQIWIMGLATVPIWQAIALLMTSPFFVTLGAAVFLKERVTPTRWLAVLFGFIGGMIILAPWSDAFTSSALLPLGAAFLWAMSSLLTKFLTRQDGPDTLTMYLLILLTPINAALAFKSGFAMSGSTAFGLVVIAGVLTAAAQFMLAKAYSVADAAYLQPFDHLKMPMNILLGWLAFGFVPAGSMWLGSLLILGASAYLLTSEARGVSED